MAPTALGRGFCLLALLSHVTLASEELKGFLENVTVDFNSGNILAEIVRTFVPRTSTHRATGARLSTTRAINGDLDSSTEIPGPKLGRVIETSPAARISSEILSTSGQATTMMASMTSTEVMTPVSLNNDEMTLETPPRITKPLSQRRVIVLETERFFTYRCEADGNPRPSYEWYRNDQLLDDRGDFIKGFENGTLLVPYFSSREDGLFQCKARNKYGTSVSVKLPIVAEKPPIRMPDTQDEDRTVREGDSAALYCDDTPPTIPEYITRWYIEEGGSKEVKLDQRIGTDSNGTLRFAYLERGDSLSYICSLVPQNAAPQSLIRYYNKVKLQVTPHSKEHFPPKKEFASAKVKALLGHNVTLECFFSGNPTPTIQWKNNRNQVIDASMSRFHIMDNQRQLVIKNVLVEDEGNFACIGSNDLGTAEVMIQVNVTSPPLLIPNNDGTPSSLSSITVPDQRDITLRCRSQGAPGETINAPMWYRNGELLNKVNLQDRYSFNAGRTELTIRSLSKTKDTACFQCNITNSEGYLFFDGYLRVIESIKIVRKPNPSISILEREEMIDLSVKATADACCPLSINWFCNGTMIKKDELMNPPFFNYNDDGDLFMNRSSVLHEQLARRMGSYALVVSNRFDSQTVTFNLSMREPEQEPLVAASSGFKLWWVILVCGLLAIIIAVAIVIIVIKSNYPRDTYPLEKTELKHHLNPEEDLLNHSFQEI
ncbi:unnamed protein product [Lymnaea stagnalis]|uniref:Ig-like domain-containing protein n=1 Tax=Lymnaea stagnalis TaxID=6523 RepID=A0AAV2H9D2_LYMST